MVSPFVSTITNAQAPNPLANLGHQIASYRSNDQNIAASKQNMEAQKQQMGMQEKQALDADNMRKLQFINSLAKQIEKTTDPAQRAALLQPQIKLLADMGYDPQDVMNATPGQIRGVIIQTDAALAGVQRQQQTPTSIQEFEHLVKTGQMTPEEAKNAARIKAGLNPRATGNAAQTIADRGNVDSVADVEETLAKSKGLGTATGKGQGARSQNTINDGLLAADGYANIERGVELLNRLETGGIDNVALSAKQLFGVESADEAELSNRLGKAVLSQLRATFGAAFTAKEGESLAKIEAGYGKSTEGNRRLLQQAKSLVMRVAKRGMDAAAGSGDFRTAAQIQEALDFRFTDGGSETPAQEAETQEPIQGARQAPDGNWYVEKDGQFFRVDQ